MLFTTFLIATAVATTAVLSAMLLNRKPDAERTRLSPALVLVAGVAMILTALGFVMV